MPNLNGTGPFGEGPRTGRGRGRCRKRQSEQIKKSEEQSAGGDTLTPENSGDSDINKMYRTER